MFSRLSFLARYLCRPLLLLVRYKIVPDQPATSFTLPSDQPVLYITKVASASDLATLRRVCAELRLPDPTDQVEIAGQLFARTLFLEQPQPIWGRRSATIALPQGQQLLQAHLKDPKIAVALMPVSICWGRAPGKEASVKALMGERPAPSWLRKLFIILISGRHTLVQFSRPVAIREMADRFGANTDTAHKLLRVARFHFYRQQLAATGPRQPNRAALFNALLGSEAVRKAIADEAKHKKISYDQARRHAHALLEEIAADYRESTLRVGDRFLSWLWRKLYTGIKVHNNEQLRDLAQRGHEIVYLPCHRSHMDYLLLSHTIYQQGLAAPHIAAGVNLNFWPIGKFFRRGGAFFIRRSFSGNKLYSAVFREYLSQLFQKGYAVKYYSEGGRSRTGRLLQPKTGMLAMTVQAMLRGIDRPVTLVPVYLGYEHVMEVSTYLTELKGSAKAKESVFGILKAIRQLRNYGFGYVNFGEPISLNQYLQTQQPDWRNAIDPLHPQKPQWLNPLVADLAQHVMVRVNQAAAVNSINLIATCLLMTRQQVLSQAELEQQLDLYLNMLRQVPYHAGVTLPLENSQQLISHALSLHKLQVTTDEFGSLYSFHPEDRVLMNYYRHNISHLLVLPAIIATALLQLDQPDQIKIVQISRQFMPLLQHELFVCLDDVEQHVIALLAYLQHQGLIKSHAGGLTYGLQHQKLSQLALLAHNADDLLNRYAMVLNLLSKDSPVAQANLEQHCQQLAQRLLTLHGIDAPEYHDKQLFSTLINALKAAGYVELNTEHLLQATTSGQALQQTVNQLLSPQIWQSIEEIMASAAPSA